MIQVSQNGPLYIEGPDSIISKSVIFLFLNIDFVLANKADPDEMPHYAEMRCISSMSSLFHK